MLSSLGWSKPFSIPKAAEIRLNFGFGTVPTREPLGTHGLLTTTRRGEPAPL